MDKRRTFNGTIPEHPVDTVLDLVNRIDKLEQEIRRRQRITRMLCRVIEDMAIKVTVTGVE